MLHLLALTTSFLLSSSVLALEQPALPSSTSPNNNNIPPHPVVLMLQTPAPQQPQTPYLELRHLDLDHELERRQVQPAAAGAPAQAAAAAGVKPAAGAAAPVAPVVQPAAAPVAANPVAAAAAPAPAPAAPAAAAPAAGVIGAHGEVPVNAGPATALTTAPSPKSGSIGMGTLTGKVGVVKTAEAKSEGVGLAVVDKRFAFFGTMGWSAAVKVGASVLVGMAVGVGVLL